MIETTRRTEAPSHLVLALGELGVEEWPGDEHNPRILWYHAATGLNRKDALTDEAAYCGSFVARMVVEAGLEPRPPEKAFRARNWRTWGTATSDPRPGDVAVVKRIKRGADARTGSRGGWHTGFFLNYTRGGLILLSANVGDRVGADFFSRRRWDFKAFRRHV
jgi:uncharacterized protein (TIGR02594 family)